MWNLNSFSPLVWKSLGERWLGCQSQEYRLPSGSHTLPGYLSTSYMYVSTIQGYYKYKYKYLYKYKDITNTNTNTNTDIKTDTKTDTKTNTLPE